MFVQKLCFVSIVAVECLIQWIFILFWFSFFVFAAFQHQRHLYYLVYPFVILTGAGLNDIWLHGGKFIRIFKLYNNKNTDSLIQDNADLPYGKSIPPSFFQKNSISLSDWLGRILAIFIFFCIILQIQHFCSIFEICRVFFPEKAEC